MIFSKKKCALSRSSAIPGRSAAPQDRQKPHRMILRQAGKFCERAYSSFSKFLFQRWQADSRSGTDHARAEARTPDGQRVFPVWSQ
jgi:hypothetical protein